MATRGNRGDGQPQGRVALPAGWEEVLAQLEATLAARGLSRRSRAAYLADCRRFAAACGRPPAAFDLASLRSYLATLAEAGAAPATRARALSALRALGEQLRSAGVVATNPAALAETPKRGRPLPAVPTRRQVEALLEGLPADGPLGLRDRALFELAYSCGLRAAELCG